MTDAIAVVVSGVAGAIATIIVAIINGYFSLKAGGSPKGQSLAGSVANTPPSRFRNLSHYGSIFLLLFVFGIAAALLYNKLAPFTPPPKLITTNFEELKEWSLQEAGHSTPNISSLVIGPQKPTVIFSTKE